MTTAFQSTTVTCAQPAYRERSGVRSAMLFEYINHSYSSSEVPLTRHWYLNANVPYLVSGGGHFTLVTVQPKGLLGQDNDRGVPSTDQFLSLCGTGRRVLRTAFFQFYDRSPFKPRMYDL